MASRQPKRLITFRSVETEANEVRRIADREGESQSTVIRRLLRLGLDAERRASEAQQ